MSQVSRCQATTKHGKGVQCTRDAIEGQIYCTQHLKMYQVEEKEFSPALIPDITKNILSEYIDYDELKNLENKKLRVVVNPSRVEIKELFYPDGIIKIRETYIDGDLRKKETWHDNGNKKLIGNYKNGKLEGKQ